MALDQIVLDGSIVIYDTAFGAATVVALPGKITGKGKATVKGKKVCVEGDEASAALDNCMYFTASFPVPGKGKCEIDKLADNQLTKKGTCEGKAMILKGGAFTAKFTPSMKASLITPTGKQEDATPSYTGTGKFIPKNPKHKAT